MLIVEQLTERFLTRFTTLFRGGQCTYRCFPGVLLTNTPRIILSKPLAAFQHNHRYNITMDSGKRGMNPVAMTITNPRKEYWQSRTFVPHILPTELYRLALKGMGGGGAQHEINGFICRTHKLYVVNCLVKYNWETH